MRSSWGLFGGGRLEQEFVAAHMRIVALYAGLTFRAGMAFDGFEVLFLVTIQTQRPGGF